MFTRVPNQVEKQVKCLSQKKSLRPSLNPPPPPETSCSPPTTSAAATGLKGGFWIAHEVFQGDPEVTGKSLQARLESGPNDSTNQSVCDLTQLAKKPAFWGLESRQFEGPSLSDCKSRTASFNRSCSAHPVFQPICIRLCAVYLKHRTLPLGC